MLTIELSNPSATSCAAVCPELGLSHTASKHGVIDVLARKMVEAGADPDTKVAIRRDGTLVFRPVSLGYWAGIRILDPDSGGLISRSYSPMPKEVLEALCEPVQ